VEVLFEPGTGLVYGAGTLVSTVVDVLQSGGEDVAVLDTSVSHAPEVLEFQYMPEVVGEERDGCHPYIVAGASCLVSDTFGRHCMAEKLEVGSRVTITEVGAYSLVKASWFNGIALPTVYSRAPDGTLTCHKSFSFEDFLEFSGGTHEN
jgi:carboxynorspermidine decarboxylase